jgi:phosphate transport system substrate-binding protein
MTAPMRKILLFIFLLTISHAGPIHPAMGADTIAIAGSTSLLPLTQHAAEAYMKRHPEVRISVAGRGSGVGIRGIIDSTADIAGVSRELSKKELKLCAQRGVKPVTHQVAVGCVVPVVDKSNPISSLSLAQLKDVFTGEIKSWQELGGPAKPIAVMNRDSNSGTFVMFRLMVLDQARVRPDALMLASNGAMVQAVSGNPLALGYVGLGYLGSELKALAVDGITVSMANVRNGTYPLSRPLYLITKGEPKGAVKDFLEFVLSPEGQMIAQEEGFVPIH